MTQVRLRPAVACLPPYVPGERVAPGARAYKLSSNENPFPPLPSVLEAISRAAAETNRYPDMYATELCEALAARMAVAPAQIAVGTGSVAVLGHVLAAVAGAGDEVVFGWRSFESYPIAVAISGATAVMVPVGADGRLDLPGMAAAVTERTRAVLVCTPNNPTGPAVRADELAGFLAVVPRDVLVVLDEAYVDFVRDPDAVDGLDVLPGHDNVLVLRTFSKAYGLAGLRVGYAVGAPGVVAGVRATSTPFGVSTLAQAAALASLDVTDQLRERVEAIVAERERMLTGLRAQGHRVPDAQANFVWLGVGDRATALADACRTAGVLVRPFAGDGVRVSVGEPEATDRLLEVTAPFAR